MFALAATRRQLFGGTGLVAAVGMTAMLPRAAEAATPAGAVDYPVPADPTKEPGRMMDVDRGYGSRSQFETETRWVNPTKTAGSTPLQSTYGVITPSGLHYERHHAGIPNIDPAKHRLVIHGLVDRPMKYFCCRPQAVSHRVAHLFHGMLRHHRPRADARHRPHGATHARSRLHIGMDRRAAVHLAQADRIEIQRRVGAGGGCGRGREATVMDAQTLPKVQMPNRDGFVSDPRPEIFK